jgi:hypothetical protein
VGVAFSFLSAALLALTPHDLEKGPNPEIKLWAAISVNDPVIEHDRVKDRLMVSFALVNDDDRVLDPDLPNSKLFINGKELPNWKQTIAQGPRDDRFDALPPGDYLILSAALGEHFVKPGSYKIKWQGKDFEAPEIMFRVITSKDKKPN